MSFEIRPFRLSKPLLIAAGVLLAMPLVVSAQPAGPHVEAGLWESGMDFNGVKLSSQICLDGSEMASRNALSPPNRDQSAAAERSCEKQDIHPIPGGYSVNTICTTRGRVTHVSGTVMGDFKTRYAMDMTIESGGRPPQPIHMDAHRVGACPAGMKPGEARTQMDPGAMAAMIAAARARAAGGAGN
jgi:hypothetical protein